MRFWSTENAGGARAEDGFLGRRGPKIAEVTARGQGPASERAQTGPGRL